MTYSAGLLVYRVKNGQLEVLLGHMGTPWWAKKDKGAWSIPKGEYVEPEDPLAAAKREFKEELNIEAPAGQIIELGTIRQNNNKQVTAWAIEADLDITDAKSNTVEIEWPPRSGKTQAFFELDRVKYLPAGAVGEKLVAGQYELVERLCAHLRIKPEPTRPEQASLF
jgi:predicted NUDIX family NTP pyrophosphohydrolase